MPSHTLQNPCPRLRQATRTGPILGLFRHALTYAHDPIALFCGHVGILSLVRLPVSPRPLRQEEG